MSSTLNRRAILAGVATVPAAVAVAVPTIAEPLPPASAAIEYMQEQIKVKEAEIEVLKRAIPAEVATSALSADDDAELLRLDTELDAVIVDRRAQMAIDKKSHDTWMATCDAAGLPNVERDSMPFEEWRAYQHKRVALLRDDDPVDEHGCSIAWDRIHGKMWPAINAIMALKATTVAGLAVQAKAISLSFSELWDIETDWEDHHRRFIEAVCAFTGVTPVPLEVQS